MTTPAAFFWVVMMFCLWFMFLSLYFSIDIIPQLLYTFKRKIKIPLFFYCSSIQPFIMPICCHSFSLIFIVVLPLACFFSLIDADAGMGLLYMGFWLIPGRFCVCWFCCAVCWSIPYCFGLRKLQYFSLEMNQNNFFRNLL